MSKLNPTAKQQEANASHLNWMGGNSWDVNDPFVRLRMAAASCFFGEPKYYDPSGTKPTRSQFANRSRLSAENFAYLRSTLNALSPSEWRDLSPRKTIERCVDERLAVDPERTLQIASALRNEDFMRSTPQVILVRAALSPKRRGPVSSAVTRRKFAVAATIRRSGSRISSTSTVGKRRRRSRTL